MKAQLKEIIKEAIRKELREGPTTKKDLAVIAPKIQKIYLGILKSIDPRLKATVKVVARTDNELWIYPRIENWMYYVETDDMSDPDNPDVEDVTDSTKLRKILDKSVKQLMAVIKDKDIRDCITFFFEDAGKRSLEDLWP